MPEEIAALDRRISQLKNYVVVLALLWGGTTVQGILGHSCIQTTLDLYSESDLEAMIEAQDRYVDAVGI